MFEWLYRIVKIYLVALALFLLAVFGIWLFFVMLTIVALVAIYHWLRYRHAERGDSIHIYRSYSYDAEKGSFIEADYHEVKTEETKEV